MPGWPRLLPVVEVNEPIIGAPVKLGTLPRFGGRVPKAGRDPRAPLADMDIDPGMEPNSSRTDPGLWDMVIVSMVLTIPA